MLTKQEQAAAVLLGCIFGLVIVMVVIAAGWVMTLFPYEFWLSVSLACVLALVYFGALAVHDLLFWIRYRRCKLVTMYICLTCGMNTTSEERYLEHRCVVRRLRKGEGEL